MFTVAQLLLPSPIASLHTRRYTDRRPRSASRARPFPTYNVYNATTADAAWCNRDNREQDDLEVDDSGEGCEKLVYLFVFLYAYYIVFLIVFFKRNS